jgi:hypothetical protein
MKDIFDQYACLRQRQAMRNRVDEHLSRTVFVNDVDTA